MNVFILNPTFSLLEEINQFCRNIVYNQISDIEKYTKPD